MTQVSYGTITITDTTDLTTYIRYAKQVPLQSISDFQTTPDIDTHYIAVLSIFSSESEPLWNSNQWKWSEFIGTDGLSVKDTRTLYYLKTNSSDVPQVDDNTQIVSTNVQNTWTSIIPTYINDGAYWTCLEVTLSDNTTKSWSGPVEDLGLTSSQNALIQATAAKNATDLMGGHFIYGGAIPNSLTPASARVIEQIKDGTVDVTNDPSKWGHNVIIGSNGIKIRHNEKDLSAWTATDGLTIYDSISGKKMATYGVSTKFYSGEEQASQDNPLVEINSSGVYIGSQLGTWIEITSKQVGDKSPGIYFNQAVAGSDPMTIASITGNKMRIPYSVMLNAMEVGEKWRWEYNQTTHNLTLKWIGVEEEE